jgi:hypothetical protein
MSKVKHRQSEPSTGESDLASELPPDLRRIHRLYREAAKDPDFRAKLKEILKPKVPTR